MGITVRKYETNSLEGIINHMEEFGTRIDYGRLWKRKSFVTASKTWQVITGSERSGVNLDKKSFRSWRLRPNTRNQAKGMLEVKRLTVEPKV